MRAICVYCGSSPGARPDYAAAAEALGIAMAREGIELVYGGSNVGLMGIIADAVLRAGGRVVGVMPRVATLQEVVHDGLSELVEVESMHDRKRAMAERADGFVALPGGTGTLEEVAEIFVWSQIGVHAKPVALLNVADYYAPLIGLLDHMVAERFLRTEHRAGLIVENNVGDLLARMRNHRPVALDKWLDRR